MEFTLNESRITELDLLVKYLLDNDLEILYVYDLEELEVGFDIDDSKAKFYCEILENYGLIKESLKQDNVFLINRETLIIFLEQGGFMGIARTQREKRVKEEEKEARENELTELQLKQIRIQSRKVIYESWWFWVSGAIIIINTVLSVIAFFRG